MEEFQTKDFVEVCFQLVEIEHELKKKKFKKSLLKKKAKILKEVKNFPPEYQEVIFERFGQCK